VANRLGTGPQCWPLQSQSTDNPTLTQGAVTSFPLNSIPDRCKSGPLAYYLPFILLTISGTYTTGAGAAVVSWDKFVGALIQSLEVSGTWMGSPVQPQFVLGKHLAVSEYVANGFRYATRRRVPFASTNQANVFDCTVAVPLCARYGRLISETSQLAKLFQTGTFKVNVAPASVIQGLGGANATLTNLTARASAVLVPRQEIVLGTPCEIILHSIVAGGANVVIQNFGRDTGYTGVKNKGGVFYLGELTTFLDSTAAFASTNVTQFSFPWRDQVTTNHVLALAIMQHQAMINDRSNAGAADLSVANRQTDFPSFPYTDLATEPNPSTANLDLNNMLAWPLVPGSDDTRLTELETASKDELYNLVVTGGFSNSHLLIGHYAKEWEEAKVVDWIKQVTNGGPDSLAAYVLGADRAAANAANPSVANLHRRTPRESHALTNDQLPYLPYQMF
jgi:hypothetical protein